MKSHFGLALVLLAGLAAPALAQQAQGDKELQFQGSLSIGRTKDQTDSGTASVLFGRFLTDRQEVGLDVLGNYDTSGGFSGSGGLTYRYHFSTSAVVPYLGASVKRGFGRANSGSGTSLTPEIGTRLFADRHSAFTLAVSEDYSLRSKEFGKSLGVQFGFSHLFGQ